MLLKQKILQTIIASVFIVGLIGLPAQPDNQPVTRAHPLLLQIASEKPGQQVAVIVQKVSEDNRLEGLVAQLGGLVTKELQIINAFAAELEAADALTLARHPDVRFVSLDAAVERSAVSSGVSVYDSFSTERFDGNDGTANWSGPWQELGESNGATNGYVRINTGWYCASSSCISIGGWWAYLTGFGLSRQADLSSSSTATLSFSFRRKSYDVNNKSVLLQISTDGGTSWTTLAVYHLNVTDFKQISQTFDISGFQSEETQIRFMATGYLDGYFNVDNVRIDYNDWKNQHLETSSATQVHAQGLTGQGVGIAVIDSGIANHEDLSGRLVQPTEFPTSDPYGHGTHVAGIAAGSGSMYMGVAPGAHVINLNITDANGMAKESDVVAALGWVYENRSAYNIRVVNMSLNSTLEGSYHDSPIDAASEILWFNSVVVVASVGNKGPAGGYNTAKTAPANDPFLIVVGASDEHDTTSRSDDTYAPFASFGTTQDGFNRPDIVAPGFNIVAALSSDSSWKVDHPERVIGNQYIRLNGTSMAAPIVAGAVALLLQDEPNLTPDQVKYRLMNSGSTIHGDGAAYPYLDIYAAVNGTSNESANLGLLACKLLWTGEDQVAWNSVAWNSVAWNSVAWNSVAWNSVAWNSVAWNSAIELDGIFWGGRGGNSLGKGGGKGSK